MSRTVGDMSDTRATYKWITATNTSRTLNCMQRPGKHEWSMCGLSSSSRTQTPGLYNIYVLFFLNHSLSWRVAEIESEKTRNNCTIICLIVPWAQSACGWLRSLCLCWILNQHTCRPVNKYARIACTCDVIVCLCATGSRKGRRH